MGRETSNNGESVRGNIRYLYSGPRTGEIDASLAQLARIAELQSASAVTTVTQPFIGPRTGDMLAVLGARTAPAAQRAARDWLPAVPAQPKPSFTPYAEFGTERWGTPRNRPVRPAPQRQHAGAKPEPVRDWSIGFITGHRADVVLYMTICILALYQLQSFLWHPGPPVHGTALQAWSWASLLWLNALIPGILGIAGLITYRHPDSLDQVSPIPRLVCWRIVSRGTNTAALIDTIHACRMAMMSAPLFRHMIEVVTDKANPDLPSPAQDLAYITVPSWYQTPNRSQFKARALQYALETSPLGDQAWLVHLDEETHPTPSAVKGIARMIRDEEQTGRLRIGQGAILYHRNWKEHPFLTLADMVRTGDDFARFHFAHRAGVTIFGLHGSYIVVRNDVEKSVGFDFGPQGSITEDAFWALKCMQAGIRCRWVEGYMAEQSTQGIVDFLKQRRRWFQGLVKVSLHAPVKLRWRLGVGLNTLLWALAPFTLLYTVAHFFYGGPTMPWIQAMANASFAAFATLYLIGLKANLNERGIRNPLTRLGWTLLQAALLPVFTVLEGAAVMMAIIRPGKGFHVVKK